MKTFHIDSRLGRLDFGIGRPLMIAEIGVNHECSIARAEQMIDECVALKLPAVKFQTYKAEKLAASDSPPYWDTTFERTESQRQLFAKYDHFSIEDYRHLARYCYERSILFMSTAFDLQSLNEINPLVDAHKVSSSDITNIPLLRSIGAFQKPVVLSTGASDIPEIQKAVSILESSGAPQVAILHCVLNYPTADKNAALHRITALTAKFPGRPIGYSDHTIPDKRLLVLQYAHALGASVIEKHYTFDKTIPGNDHYHAFDFSDGRRLMADFARFGNLLGESAQFDLNNQTAARENARRGIYLKSNVSKGETLSESNLITLRPVGVGIPAEEWDKVIGRTARRDLLADQVLQQCDYIDE